MMKPGILGITRPLLLPEGITENLTTGQFEGNGSPRAAASHERFAAVAGLLHAILLGTARFPVALHAL
jgi:hypothetical protein